MLCACALAGCAKKPLSKAETRAVTSEIVDAAERVAAHRAEVQIEPELPNGTAALADRIVIVLPSDSEFAPLRQALGGIAAKHHLAIVERAARPRHVDFTFNGWRSHSIDISTRVAVVKPRPAISPAGGARLAIIIDDLGHDGAAADSVLALPFPLTLSVLPNLPLSAPIAEEAHRRKDEVMLHLPMESQGESVPSENTKPEAVELRVGMTPEQVSRTVTGMLATVPDAAGVNNHQGSRATADPALMRDVMESLRGRNLFFIDSRTTAATVAYNTAESLGVPAASRKVFLDDKLSVRAILAQLELAARDAQQDGSAIAIGHPHRETVAALARDLPRLRARGIKLVFASELVR